MGPVYILTREWGRGGAGPLLGAIEPCTTARSSSYQADATRTCALVGCARARTRCAAKRGRGTGGAAG
eukprot:scaffold5895_cov161-Prasinococcus_capsulatus_cf.AAC.1